MDYVHIKGYKSIKDAKIELRPINILIGANGSGKSNFLSFFEFLNNLYERKLTEYIALNGGEDKFLHHGGKVTQQIEATLSFDNKINEYAFTLEKGEDKLVFKRENLKDSAHEALFIYGVVGIFLGARLGHCLFYDFEYYLKIL